MGLDSELASKLMWLVLLSSFSVEVKFRDIDDEMGFLGDEVTEEFSRLVKVSVFSDELK